MIFLSIYLPIYLKKRKTNVPAQTGRQEGKEPVPPSSPFRSVQAVNRVDHACPHWGGRFTKSPYLHADLMGKHPHRHTQN